jgi:hypothetical protein
MLNPVIDPLVHARNIEALRRFAAAVAVTAT